MPTILIGPYLLRKQPGPFRKILSDAGFELIDPEGDFALTHEQLQSYLPRANAMLAGGERLTAVFSPHIAGIDLQSMSDMAELAARTVVELYHNRWPAACVVNGDVRLGLRW